MSEPGGPGLADGAAPPAAPPEPAHKGHRQRLKARFREGGPEAVADYELLELLLFRSIPQRDVKPLAKALIARYGSFAAVLAQPIERLMDTQGVSTEVATDLKIIQAAGVLMTREAVLGRPVVTSWSALLSYLRAQLAEATTEEFRVLFLDKKNTLLRDERLGRGTVDHAPVYPREVLVRALACNATAVILVHNHPSGDPTPSKADIDMTKEIVAALRPLSILVHDHVVVGRERVASFKALGLL